MKEFRQWEANNPKNDYAAPIWRRYALGNSLSNKVLKHIIDLFGYIPLDIIYANYVSETDTKDRIEQKIATGKKDSKSIYEEKEKNIQAQKEREEGEQEDIKSLAEDNNISVENAKKILDIADKLDKYDKELKNKTETHSGYKGGESTRSVDAKLNGKYPLAVAKKLFDLSEKQIKENFKPTEWHHTGALYNATTYYDLSELKDAFYYNDVDYIKKIYNINDLNEPTEREQILKMLGAR